MRMVPFAAAAALMLAGCASSHEPPGPPSLAIAPGAAAPAQVRFYADCIAQAASQQSYDREDGLIRFRCAGAPAQAFYDGLAAWSAAHNSEIIGEGRTWRFTVRMEHNPSGLDYCWRDDAGGYGCTVVLNAGPFIEPAQ